MATVQEPARTVPRHESFVEAELARARSRIRAQDVGTAALGLVVGTLAYALGMVLLDRWVELPLVARQITLVGYLLAAAAYVAIVLLLPFRREVNPYFAARQVERAVPGAKNSVISWLDLRDEPLPPSIRTAVGLKAANDLKRADLNEVVRDRRLPWLGGIAGGLFFAVLILFFLLRPAQFLSLLGRAFAPFHSTAIATRTELTLLLPAEGNITVPVNKSIDFRAGVAGRVPDPGADDGVRLRFRYNPADPVWEELRLSPSARDPHEWAVRMPSERVQNGFVYQVVGGDAATPEYRVQVRSSPLIEGFDVVYHYRPYLRFRDQATNQPNLVGLRGTEVTLTARTNRKVREGKLTFQPTPTGEQLPSPQVVAGALVPELPNALRFRFVLDQDGKYTIHFETAEGEKNENAIPYTVQVLSDYVPQVDVTRPAADTLPVNGALQVEGKASDDFGITKMRLCLQMKDKAEAEKATRLADKPYRPDKSFKFDDGTYPKTLDYLDVLALDQLKTPLGVAVEPKPGLVIEYWLEAEDNYDYPDPTKPNVGRSKVYRTTLAAPQDEKDKQEQAQGAANDKQKHNQEQDANHAKENEGKKNQQQAANPQQNPDQQPQQGDPEKPQDKPGDNPKDRDLKQKANDVQEQLQQRERDKQKGEGRDEGKPEQADPDKPGEPKGEPKGDGDPNNTNPQQQSGEPKGEPKGDPKAGQQPQGGQQPKGVGKNEGKAEQPPEPGDAKPEPNSDQSNTGGKQGDNQKPIDPGQANNTSGNNQGDTGPQNPGGQRDQPKNETGEQNPGAAKPQPKDPANQPNPGDTKSPPQPGDQTGADKPSENVQTGGSDKGSGNEGKPGGDPNTVNPPSAGGDPTPPKAGSPNSPPPTQPGNDRGNTKASDQNRPPSEQQPKNDQSKSDPKQETGRGSASGNQRGAGDQQGAGPQKDPNDQQPRGNPDTNKSRDGHGSKNDSGKPGGTPPPGTKPEKPPEGQGDGGKPEPQPGQPKERGAQEPVPDKGDAKPTGGDSDANDPGRDAPGAAKGDPPPKGVTKDAQKPAEPGAPPPGEPRTPGTPSDGKPQGDAKPDKAPTGNDQARGGEQGDGKGQIKPDQKPADGQGRKPTADDIAKIAEKVRNADPATRQEAMKKLEDLKNQMGDAQSRQAMEDAMKQMSDPQTRQAIEDLMKQMGDAAGPKPDPNNQRAANDPQRGQRGDRGGPGDKADPNRPPQPGQRGADEQPGQSPQRGDPSAKAPAGQGRDSGRGDAAAKGQPPSGQPQRGQPGADDPSAKANDGTGDKTNQPGATPTQPQAGSPVAGNTGAGSVNAQSHGTDKPGAAQTPAELGPPPDAAHAAKTGDLQLEKLPKNPDPELLKDLKMTADEYRQFLKDMADYEKRRQAAQAADGKTLERGATRGNSAANTGTNRVEAGTNKTGDLNRGPASPAPPEYRDGYKGFTEDVSKTAPPPKKDK